LNERIGDDADGCVVIVFNVQRLQTINATLGRAIGDALLVAIVERVDAKEEFGLGRIGRLGGDRFAVFACGQVAAGGGPHLGERLSRLLVGPYQIGDQVVRIAVRAGVAEGAAGDDAEELLGKAKLALDEARFRAGSGLRSFDQEGFARQARARHIERAHWNALTEEEVYLTYQPQVRLRDGALVGAEALERWKHPTLGMISPAEFIDIAERSGFIEHLGRWVLETACFDAKEWPEDQLVSVNVSPAQFHRSDVVADVERALAVSGLPPKRLYLEITESLFFGATAGFSDVFAGLRRLGVSLALDDFGSGYSSYGHLARLPLDKLKVDRMFVQGLDVVPFNQAVIRSVGSLCTELGLTLVCEGVETEAQVELLKQLGCDEAQGFLFGRPEPQEEFLRRFP
jgi:predicted signal transduction protein with EAL and GGDEF domain